MISNRDSTQGSSQSPPETEVIQGIVTNVHENGGDTFVSVSLRTATAEVPQGTHITFSMKDWAGTTLPRKGQVVVLEEINLFDKGWRALSARPVQTGKKEPEGERR